MHRNIFKWPHLSNSIEDHCGISVLLVKQISVSLHVPGVLGVVSSVEKTDHTQLVLKNGTQMVARNLGHKSRNLSMALMSSSRGTRASQ